MDNMRVVLANAPRSYRESLAVVFQRLRPQVSFITVDPTEVDALVRNQKPHLVVCSRLSTAIEQHVRGWIMLPPDGQSAAVMHATGELSLVADLDLAGLLAVIDQGQQRLAQELAAHNEF